MYKILATLLLSFAMFAQAAAPAAAPAPAAPASPPPAAVVQGSGKFVEGKDYKLLPPTAAQGPTAKALLDTHTGKVEVINFFSYGCPVCNRMEPMVEKWTDSKKSTQMIAFVDVPVNWDHPGWENLARAFYIAESLNVLDKAHPALFNAIHVQQKNFKNQADLQEFFLSEAGVPRAKFDETFDSFTVRRRMKQGDLLRDEYGVMAIPAFVINGKYYVDVQTAGGMAQVLDVVEFLVNKESFTKGAEEIDFNDVPAKTVPISGKPDAPAPTTAPSTAP